MKWWLVLFTACAPSLQVTRTTRPALHDAQAIAVAASGPYALELVAGVRAKVGSRAKVEACVLGCPPVGLYASVSLTPGPHEGRVLRTCQLEVYEGPSWMNPTKKRAELVRSVDDLDGCVKVVSAALLEPSTDVVRLPLDARGVLEPMARDAAQGKLDEARAALLGLLEKDPNLAGAQYDLAVIAEARGQRDEAVKGYGAARRSQPDEWLSAQLERCP